MFTFYYYLLSKRRKVFEREKRRERTTTTALCLLGNDALFRDDFLCMRARAMIYSRMRQKKGGNYNHRVFFLFPFSRLVIFSCFFAGTKKISFMKFREKKVEKHSEGAEQNSTKTLLSLSLTPVSLLRVLNRTQQRYIII